METENGNQVKKSDFNQVCVWPGTILGKNTIEELEEFFKETFDGTRIQHLEQIKTLPDKDGSGENIAKTGGREDMFFAVHRDDVEKFTLPRMQYGIRWIEDAIGEWNGGNRLYPKRVEEYKTW